MRNRMKTSSRRGGLVTAILFATGACANDTVDPGEVIELSCDLTESLLVAAQTPNGIPALTNPPMVPIGDVGADYLFDDDRVLGVYINGEARAYPHNIMWWHEIVNDDIGGTPIAVTFCPLTGSGLAFDPRYDGRVLDVGVSGLLFANNLVMYDRTTEEVYGPQLGIEGACSGFRGSSLELMPVQEMSWGRWKELHPNTTVVTGELPFGRNYRSYPYGSYDDIGSDDLLFPMSVDVTRPIKERVLAIRDGQGGRGYPFGELAEIGTYAAVNESVGGVPSVVFYEGAYGETALAFDARVNGQTLTFEPAAGINFVDIETGSTWTVDGTAIDGPLAGERLRTREDAYTLFWFAWRHFQPDGTAFAAP